MLRCAHLLRTRVATRSFSTEWRALEKLSEGVIQSLDEAGETVSVAEWTSGGLISAALWSSPDAHRCFRGAGVRLAYGVNREADREGRVQARDFAREKVGSGWPDGFQDTKLGQRESARWGLVYEEGVAHSESGTAVHALELAHAAKLNLGTDWGIGESSVPGPNPHHRTGLLAGMGFVAVAGPTRETTGVLKVGPSDASRSENMACLARAAIDLMAHLLSNRGLDRPHHQTGPAHEHGPAS